MADRKRLEIIFLGFILLLVFFLRLPSLFEPANYGDEGIYQVLGQVLKRGGLLYRDIWDNKPPFLYLLYALFNGEQLGIRLLSLIFALLTTLAFYFFAKEIFKNLKNLPLFSTLVFAVLFSLPLLEGNIANAENFMLLPIILALFFGLKFGQKTGKNFYFFLPGFLLGVSFLFKIVAIFDFGALIIFLLILKIKTKNLRLALQKIFPPFAFLVLGFVLPFLGTTLFFGTKGILKDFFLATFTQNVGYVAWGNKFFLTQGALFLKIFLLFLFCFFLYLRKEKINKGELFIFLWFAFSLVNALLAGRPYTHYLLVLLPSFCLLLGNLGKKTNFWLLTLALIFLTFYLSLTQFWLYKKTGSYYQNFFAFLLGKKSLGEYRSFWGNHVNRDYQVSEFLRLKTAPCEPVFLWGNNPQIYALSQRPVAGRYTVAYHITSYPGAFPETVQAIKAFRPKYFIILQPQTDPLKDLKTTLSQNYRLFLNAQGFTVYERDF